MSIRSLRFDCAILTSCALGCVLGVSASVRAEDFSWQLSGGTSHREVGDLFDADTSAIDATYYFDPVDDTDGPYALASFFNPTTRVSAAVSEDDAVPFGSGSFGTVLADGPTAYTLSGRYVWPSTQWYAGASYSTSDVDNVLPIVRRTDPKSYSVLAGTYLGRNTTIELEAGSSTQRSETHLLCPPTPFCTSVPITVEFETDVLSLDVAHVRQVGSLTYALYGRISQTDTDIDIRAPTVFFPGTLPTPPPPFTTVIGVIGVAPVPIDLDDRFRVYSVAGELFPIRRLGVRLGYSRPDGANLPDGDAYDLAATWFFKPHVAMQVSVARASQGDLDTDFVALRFIGRL
jgi:hypothetical protein